MYSFKEASIHNTTEPSPCVDKLVENQCDIFNITEEEYHTKCEDDMEYVNRNIHCGMDTCVVFGQNQAVKQ